ncbi:hypothetical protein [Chryseobacterium limigenitum]|uniref:Uncharacterized protein n=1 Tax=Chryseobacterium limigenitum TaxID=1612149 RepID=A0A1K2IWX7_9FLAO|nr:hypothetical protein [Chryseobacterium limigenitum]SFZ96932.1 hypothetical protein SAMN05216324_13026 [Chryseobacterium limigenitum]
MKLSEQLIHLLILIGILTLIYLVICKLLKPLGALPKALAEALEQLLIIVFEMIAKLVHYIVVFIKSTVPVIFEHLLKLIIALFLFVVRGFTWLINGIVSLLNRLFRLTQN